MKNAVLFETHDNIAIITLNRPDQRNAVNADVCDGLRDAVDRLENTPKLRVGILRGAGNVFCAGMDLKAFLSGDAMPVLNGEHGFGGFVKRERTKPIIAEVHGAALAGGFEIMLACDMVVAEENTVFGLPEPKIGLTAAAGGAVRLGAMLPPAIANEILLTGDTFDAAHAKTWGLVNRVVTMEKLQETSKQLAQKIAANAPIALTHSLKLAAIGGRATSQMWQASDQAIASISDTQDSREGVAAFLEKRRPNWSGR